MTSASLKVTVNGRKFQVSGITKQTSCKDLLCALAKVTTSHVKALGDACNVLASNGESTELDAAPSDHRVHEGHSPTHQGFVDEALSGLTKDRGALATSHNKVKQVRDETVSEIKNRQAKENTGCSSMFPEPCEVKGRNKRSIYHVKRVLEENTYLSIEAVQCGNDKGESSQNVVLRSKIKKHSKAKRLSGNLESVSSVERNEESKKDKRRKHRSWTFTLDEDKEEQSKQIIETLILCSENSLASPGTEKLRGATKTSTTGNTSVLSPRNHKVEDNFLRDHLRVVLKEKALEIKEIPVHVAKTGAKKASKSKTSKRSAKPTKTKGKRPVESVVSSSALVTDTITSLDRRKGDSNKVMHPTLGEGTELKDYGSLQNVSLQTKEIKAQMKEMKKAEFLEELRKSSPTYIIDENVPMDKSSIKASDNEIENDNDSGVQTVEYDSSQEMDASPAELLTRVEEESGIHSSRTTPDIEKLQSEGKETRRDNDETKMETEEGSEGGTTSKSESSAPEVVSTLKRRTRLSFDDSFITKDASFGDTQLPLAEVCSVSTNLGNRGEAGTEVKRRPSLRKTDNCLDLTRVASCPKNKLREGSSKGNSLASSADRRGSNTRDSQSARKELGRMNFQTACSSHEPSTFPSPDLSGRRRHSIPRSESLSELSLVSVASDSKSSSGDERFDDRDIDRKITSELRKKTDKASSKAIWQETYQHTKLLYDYRQLTKSLMELLDELLYKELLIVHLSAKLQATDGHTNEADDRLLAMEEMAIAKDLMGLKNLIRSVTDLTKYQRREMQDVSEEIDHAEWELSKRTYDFESLHMKLANQRTKGAPRALVKRKKGGFAPGQSQDEEEENAVSLV